MLLSCKHIIHLHKFCLARNGLFVSGPGVEVRSQKEICWPPGQDLAKWSLARPWSYFPLHGSGQAMAQESAGQRGVESRVLQNFQVAG